MTFGPAAIITDKTDLSKIDPVKTAYRSLSEALRLLNSLQGDSLAPSDPRWSDAHERICEVLQQLTGWDCCDPYRLVKVGGTAEYRSDLDSEEENELS